MKPDRLVTELAVLGVRPVASDANFVLFGGLSDEGVVWQQLLDRGVLIRDVGIRHHLRVTTGNESECTVFLSALADSLAGSLAGSLIERPVSVQENR